MNNDINDPNLTMDQFFDRLVPGAPRVDKDEEQRKQAAWEVKEQAWLLENGSAPPVGVLSNQ